MAKLPTVAIIGRPNTGKSTLFNRLVGRRKAIVSDVPGTTRDHIAHKIESEKVDYLLLDTGGIGGGTTDIDFEDDVEEQSRLAMEHADVILFTVNGQEELTSADYEVANLLRKNKKRHVPVILTVSKMDNPTITDEELPRFYELGISDDIIPVSAPHKLGMEELQSAIENALVKLQFRKQEYSQSDEPRIAILGKPNVGKSSIINALLSDAKKQSSPLLVSETPGTTRDSVDTEIKFQGKSFVFTDTAGLKRSQHDLPVSGPAEIERLSALRTIQSLERSDIAILVIDATEPLTRQDKRIASMVIEEGKGIIFLLNKTDLLSAEEKERAMDQFAGAFPFCTHAPLVLCSAITREGLLKLFDPIAAVAENRARRIPTAKLNAWFTKLMHTSNIGTANKANYITQVEVNPPTFVLFVHDPKAIALSDIRHIENKLRKEFPFEGTPIRWVTRKKS